MPKGRGQNRETSTYKFLTEVLDNDWRVVYTSLDTMRKEVNAHNHRFGAAGWLWVEIRSHSKGCEARKARRDGSEG
jgi:hypothetical protein